MKKLIAILFILISSLTFYGQDIRDNYAYKIDEHKRDKNEFIFHLGWKKSTIEKYRSDESVYKKISFPQILLNSKTEGLCYYDLKRKVIEAYLFNDKDVCYDDVFIPITKELAEIVKKADAPCWKYYNSQQFVNAKNRNIIMEIKNFSDGSYYFDVHYK